jgi:hypothetical protein
MHGTITLDAGKTPGVVNHVVMKEKHEPNAPWRTTQHWEIVPVGKGEYSNTHAQLRLVYGGLCLSRTDAATSKSGDGDSDSRYGLTMAKCADPNDAHELVDIPKNQIFAFHGFAEQSEDLAPAFEGAKAAVSDMQAKKDAVQDEIQEDAGNLN